MKLGRCESCETLREMLHASDARYGELIEKYHLLKLRGAFVPEERQGLAPASRPSKAADQAIDTIVERFNGNVQLRRRLARFVNLERQKPNADEEQIADRVLNWREAEEA